MADIVLKKREENKAKALFFLGEDMKDNEDNKVKKFLKEYVPYIIVLVFVVLIKKYVVSPIKVNGDSMFKTLHDGDIMILNIVGYRFKEVKRFDIVVVREDKEFLIKRVIGLPGEKISYHNNQLFVNGKKVKDSYGNGSTDDFSIEVPKGKYFVLGDNRENSMDSRVFGPFSKKRILGKTKLIVFPFSRFGLKK